MAENADIIENIEDLHREACKGVFDEMVGVFAPGSEVAIKIVHDREYKVLSISKKGPIVLGLCETGERSCLVLFPQIPELKDNVTPVLWMFECRNSRFSNRAYESYRYLELIMHIVSELYGCYTKMVTSKYSVELAKKLGQSGE